MKCFPWVFCLIGVFVDAQDFRFFQNDKLLSVTEPKKDVRFSLGGRFFHDSAWLEESGERDVHSDVRAARLVMDLRVGDSWRLKAEADKSAKDIRYTDIWLSYKQRSGSVIKIGQQKEPISLERLTSSKDISFMERALPAALTPGQHLGITYHMTKSYWQMKVGAFGPRIDGPDSESLTGRFSFTPYLAEDRLVHLGLSGSIRRPDHENQNRLRFQTRPEGSIPNIVQDTGFLHDISQNELIGLEVAAAKGPHHIQAEWIESNVRFRDGSGLESDGWYVANGWILTGENKPYSKSDGVFKRIRPRGILALELASRFSKLDLGSNSALAGISENISIGLNMYFESWVRLTMNYIHSKQISRNGYAPPLAAEGSFSFFQTRLQIVF